MSNAVMSIEQRLTSAGVHQITVGDWKPLDCGQVQITCGLSLFTTKEAGRKTFSHVTLRIERPTIAEALEELVRQATAIREVVDA